MSQTYNLIEAAEEIGIDRSTLYRWMKNDMAPPHFRQGGRIFFPKDLLKTWMQEKASPHAG